MPLAYNYFESLQTSYPKAKAPNKLPWFFFLALIPTVVGHNIFYYLIKTLSTTTVAAVPLGEPIVSSVGALFLFGEPISSAVIVGGGITLFGVFLVVRFGS